MQFGLKHFAAAAVSAQIDGEASILFAKEPEFYGPDADISFVDQPGYSDANATRDMDFNSLDGMRQLQIVEGVVVGFQIASAVAPIIADIIKKNKKECQQVVCWISSDSRTCAINVAERVQNEVTQGRERYRYESIADNGMWVSYWRTKFEPIDREDIAAGNCTEGIPFTVTNCQSTGRVHC